jgi:hypothetical protein
MELTFYTTEACHLCELAEAVLVNTPLASPVPVNVVDISESETLVERYGTRIPVLQRSDDGKELNWPFIVQDVQRFVGHSPP